MNDWIKNKIRKTILFFIDDRPTIKDIGPSRVYLDDAGNYCCTLCYQKDNKMVVLAPSELVGYVCSSCNNSFYTKECPAYKKALNDRKGGRG